MIDRTPTRPAVPDFTPVPRRKSRHDGWTVDRQRAFIDALAQTGSVKHAAHRVNMAPEGAYMLRRQPGAESFRAAWEAALDHGVQSLADIAIDRAREGVPVPIFHKGEQVGEKRRYNDRLMMFVLRHHLPHRYGPLKALAPGTKHPDTLAREAEEDAAARADLLARTEEWMKEKAADFSRLAWLHRKKVHEMAEARIAGHAALETALREQLQRIEKAMNGDPRLWHIWSAFLPAIEGEPINEKRDWE